MQKTSVISHSRLTSILEYFQETGKFTWRLALSIRAPIGSEAGWTMTNGYISIGMDGQDYLAHRLAWFYVKGEWPKSQIDHINGIKNDNRFFNLRPSTNAGNAINKKKPRRDNSSGEPGVHFDKSRQRWLVTVGKKFCGRFSSKEDAIKHRREVARPTYGEFFPL